MAVDERNHGWWRQLMDVNDDHLLKLRYLNRLVASSLIFGDPVHPETISVEAGGAVFMTTCDPVVAGNRGAIDNNTPLYIEDCINTGATPVLVMNLKNNKYYTMYMVPKHDEDFTSLFDAVEVPEANQYQGFSKIANDFAFSVNGVPYHGTCVFPCNSRNLYELVFIPFSLASPCLGWEEDEDEDEDDSEDSEDSEDSGSF